MTNRNFAILIQIVPQMHEFQDDYLKFNLFLHKFLLFNKLFVEMGLQMRKGKCSENEDQGERVEREEVFKNDYTLKGNGDYDSKVTHVMGETT